MLDETSKRKTNTVWYHLYFGEGRGRGRIAVWDQELKTTMCKIVKQQGYTVHHRELYPLFVISLTAVSFIKIGNHYAYTFS